MPSESASRVAKLCAKWGGTCLVSHGRKPVATEEPDGLIGLVRDCGEGAEQPVPLPGKHLYKDCRDNVGKGHLSAGSDIRLRRLSEIG
jgi:hypothetical protein